MNMNTRNSRTLTKQLIKSSLGTTASPQKRWRHRAEGWGKSAALLELCAPFQKQRSFLFTCSDDEAYDVFSVVDGRDALPLLAAGVRSAEEARDFLSRHGLDHLIEDNFMVAKEAAGRGLTPRRVFEAASDLSAFRDDPNFMDAVDAGSQDSIVSMNRADIYAVSMEILKGTIDYSHLQKIGLPRVAKASYSGNYDEMMGYLRKLVTKELSYGIYIMARTMKLADKKSFHGLDALELLGKYGFEKMKTVMDYYLDVMNLSGNVEILGDLSDAYDAGVSIELSAEGIVQGLTCDQIVASFTGEVHSAVAKGWL